MARRLLLDTSSLMFRAFFAIPSSVRDAAGRPVNALHGYLDMTGHLLQNLRPSGVVHVFDHDWRPAPRVAAYDGYKAARPPDPEGLPEQFLLLREVLDLLGQEQAEAPDWEAEDAIGAIVRAGMPGESFDIVTGDRDLTQLVRDPEVRVLFTVRGVSDLRTLDEAGVLERFGVPAARYADFATLRGDPSDGLPGVPGVGEKTARALVEAYGGLDELLGDAARDDPRKKPLKGNPKLRARIRASADYLAAMRDVVPIRTDVEVRRWRSDPDPARLDALAAERRLEGPLRRFRQAQAASATD